ncbi:MAG: chitobiase/beta-hexosaminidase C-terminal domain-containing protein [Anaerolineaceae bacterium]
MLFVLINPVFAEGAWVGGWETLADANSLVILPTDIAVDSNRTLYAVDLGWNLVLKKESTVTTWTFLPNQPYNSLSHSLVGVTVDTANNVYVLNGYGGTSNVLWKYNGSTWSDVASGTQFIQPCSVAVDQSNNVYVADKSSSAESGCNQIRKLPGGGGSWSVVGSWTNGGFTKIVSITTDINNYLYAIEALEISSTPYSRLVRMTPATTAWSAYPSSEGQVNTLNVPNDIAVDRFGNVYVTDHQTQELHVFAKNATMWAQIRKDGNLIFNDIFSVAVDNKGYVYVCDPDHDISSTDRRIFRHQPWATQLIWETQPSGKPALQILSPSPVLSLAGPGGDLITGVNANTADVSLTTPAGATLGGTRFRTFNNGKATFNDLSVDKAGTYSLTGHGTIASTNIKNAVWNFPNVDLSNVSNNFTITAAIKAVTPTASPASGATVFNNSAITLSSTTAGAHFHYTTDGSTPTGTSPSGNQVTLTGANGSNVSVKAIASAATYADSDVAIFTYTIAWPKAAMPTANPADGATVLNNSIVTLSSTTPGAHFHYTTDGSTPTGTSPSGNQVTLTGAHGSSMTVKAIASVTSFLDSEVATFTYTIAWPKAAMPTANPADGATVLNNSVVTLSSTTPGVHFHYTTDGSTPTGTSLSGNQVLIKTASDTSMTVKAVASATSFLDSETATFTYTIEHRLFLPIITR